MFKRTFADVYGRDYTPTIYTAPEYTDRRIDATSTNVYVHDCVFRSCTSSSKGGAILCSSNVYRLLVEESSFISCKTSNNYGGGVYFYNMGNGECVFSRICGFGCTATSWGQFSQVYLKDSINIKNQVNDSSFTQTSKETSGQLSVVDHDYGKILCPSVNITNNECYRYTAIYFWPTSSDTCCISYSSIVNNTANGNYGCMYLGNSAASHFIDTCNILNNKQTTSDYGTIYTSANLHIKDSCILGNNEGYTVFYEDSSSKQITISNCTIDNGRSYGSVTITKTIESSFINALSHIATQSCDSYFDSYGTLSVKPNVPSKSLRIYLSCNKEHPIIDSLRNIQFMFLLTFLPSNPSNSARFNHICSAKLFL